MPIRIDPRLTPGPRRPDVPMQQDQGGYGGLIPGIGVDKTIWLAGVLNMYFRWSDGLTIASDDAVDMVGTCSVSTVCTTAIVVSELPAVINAATLSFSISCLATCSDVAGTPWLDA